MFKFFEQKKIITPNCKTCKWSETYRQLMNNMTFYDCGAQANKKCSEVYNNKLCKKLYEKKEEITKENNHE